MFCCPVALEACWGTATRAGEFADCCRPKINILHLWKTIRGRYLMARGFLEDEWQLVNCPASPPVEALSLPLPAVSSGWLGTPQINVRWRSRLMSSPRKVGVESPAMALNQPELALAATAPAGPMHPPGPKT